MASTYFPSLALNRTQKLMGRCRAVSVALVLLSGPAFAANVTVNVSNNLFIVASNALGMHTSVYDNQNGNSTLPTLLQESGVNTLRYPGGGYADVFHWSISKPDMWANGYGMTPWWGVTNNYGYMGYKTDFGNFALLLSNANAQAVITVDYGSAVQWNSTRTKLIAPNTNGQPLEAAAWVAYANANTNVFIYGTANDLVLGRDALSNNWKTVGFWAKLRATSAAQYQSWAGTNYDTNCIFLAISHPAPFGIKYWEIGNETFGTGYYDSGGGDGYSVDYAVAYTGASRYGKSSLSPAFYGQKVKLFSQAMKAVDPAIKIGAVVSTPPDDYGWDIYSGQRWIPQVLAQCATNVDFVIAHWYPWAGDNDIGSNLLSYVRLKFPLMINGQTAGQDSGTSSGLRDWINAVRPDGTNVEIFITEFGYTGSLTNSILGPANALFVADAYASWMDLGVANIDYLEMGATAFLGGNDPMVRGSAFYAVKMLHTLTDPGDVMLAAASDQGSLRAHAVTRQDGKVSLLLINEDPANSQTVSVTFSNVSLAGSGIKYQFGVSNFPAKNEIPSSGLSSNTVSGLGNTFSVTVPAYTMVGYVIPLLANAPPALNPLSNVTTNVGGTVTNTIVATDADLPSQTLTFSLLSGPASATLAKINPTNAAFSWRSSVTNANTTNLITVKVADNGTPSLSATQSFTVTVNSLTPPSVSSAIWSNSRFNLQVSGQTGPDYAVQVSTNLVDWSTLWMTNSPPMPFQWADTNAGAPPMQFYRIKVGPPLP